MEQQTVLKSVYDSIPYELSGSRSKNRFRQELLWGVSKMFDLFDKPDFCVVFDYKCDIEIHLPDLLEFYQIKTHKVQEPYSFTKISRRNATTGKSIIGQLYLLRNCASPDIDVKVALVSNAYFKIKEKVYSEFETIIFSDLEESVQKTIINALKKEVTSGEVDLSKISYIYTSMDILRPEDAIRGKIIKCFEEVKGKEPIKPNALYRLIEDTAHGKACYELASHNYDEVVMNKGFTKLELNNLLDRYDEKADACVDKTMEYIENLPKGVREKKKLKSALLNVRGELITSNELKNKEIEISSFLTDNEDTLPDNLEDIADAVLKEFSLKFSVEFSKEQIYVLAILIIKRWEDCYYE